MSRDLVCATCEWLVEKEGFLDDDGDRGDDDERFYGAFGKAARGQAICEAISPAGVKYVCRECLLCVRYLASYVAFSCILVLHNEQQAIYIYILVRCCAAFAAELPSNAGALF